MDNVLEIIIWLASSRLGLCFRILLLNTGDLYMVIRHYIEQRETQHGGFWRALFILLGLIVVSMGQRVKRDQPWLQNQSAVLLEFASDCRNITGELQLRTMMTTPYSKMCASLISIICLLAGKQRTWGIKVTVNLIHTSFSDWIWVHPFFYIAHSSWLKTTDSPFLS